MKVKRRPRFGFETRAGAIPTRANGRGRCRRSYGSGSTTSSASATSAPSTPTAKRPQSRASWPRRRGRRWPTTSRRYARRWPRAPGRRSRKRWQSRRRRPKRSGRRIWLPGSCSNPARRSPNTSRTPTSPTRCTPHKSRRGIVAAIPEAVDGLLAELAEAGKLGGEARWLGQLVERRIVGPWRPSGAPLTHRLAAARETAELLRAHVLAELEHEQAKATPVKHHAPRSAPPPSGWTAAPVDATR